MRRAFITLVLLTAACSKTPAAADASVTEVAGNRTVAGAASLLIPKGFQADPAAVAKILESLKVQSPMVQGIARSWHNVQAEQRLTLTSAAFPQWPEPGRAALEHTVERTIAGIKAQGLTVETQDVVPAPDRIAYQLVASAGQVAVATRGIVAFDTEGALRNWAVTCSVPIAKRDSCNAPLQSFTVDLTAVPLKTYP